MMTQQVSVEVIVNDLPVVNDLEHGFPASPRFQVVWVSKTVEVASHMQKRNIEGPFHTSIFRVVDTNFLYFFQQFSLFLISYFFSFFTCGLLLHYE